MVTEFDELRQEIEELEKQLLDKKKEYRELRTAGLRAAIQTKNEAEKAVQEEMKALGVPYINGWSGHFKF
jgi:hypothetical protein